MSVIYSSYNYPEAALAAAVTCDCHPMTHFIMIRVTSGSQCDAAAEASDSDGASVSPGATGARDS